MNTSDYLCDGFKNLGISLPICNDFSPLKNFKLSVEKELIKKPEEIQKIWQQLTGMLNFSPPSLIFHNLFLMPAYSMNYDCAAEFFAKAGLTGFLRKPHEEIERKLSEILSPTVGPKKQTQCTLLETLFRAGVHISFDNWSKLVKNKDYNHLSYLVPTNFLILNKKECFEFINEEIELNIQRNQNNLKAEQSPEQLFQAYSFEYCQSIIRSIRIDQGGWEILITWVLESYLGTPGFDEYLMKCQFLNKIILEKFNFTHFSSLCLSKNQQRVLSYFENLIFASSPIDQKLNILESILNRCPSQTLDQWPKISFDAALSKELLYEAIALKRNPLVLFLIKCSKDYELTKEEKKFLFEHALQKSHEQIAVLVLKSFYSDLEIDWYAHIFLSCDKKWLALAEVLVQLFISQTSEDQQSAAIYQLFNLALVKSYSSLLLILFRLELHKKLSDSQTQELCLLSWSGDDEKTPLELLYHGFVPSLETMVKNHYFVFLSDKHWHTYAKWLAYHYFTQSKYHTLYPSLFFANLAHAIKLEELTLLRIFEDAGWINMLSYKQKIDLIQLAWNASNETFACLLYDAGAVPHHNFLEKHNWLHLAYSEKNWIQLANKLLVNPKNPLIASPKTSSDYLYINHGPLTEKMLTSLVSSPQEFDENLLLSILKNSSTYANMLLEHFPNYHPSKIVEHELFKWAIDKQYGFVLKQMLERTGDMNRMMPSSNGDLDSLFDYAIRHQKELLYSFFIEIKAESKFFLEIHRAAWIGNYPLVKKLITSNPDLANKSNFHGQTPLHIAILRNHKSLFEFLINYTDIESPDHKGNTPLHLAHIYSNKYALEKLLALLQKRSSDPSKKIANLSMENQNGNTPHTTSSYQYKLKFYQTFVAHGATFANDDKTQNLIFNIYNQTYNKQFIKFFNQLHIKTKDMVEAVLQIQIAHVWSLGGQSTIGSFQFELEGSNDLHISTYTKKLFMEYFCHPAQRLTLQKYGVHVYETLIATLKNINKTFKKNPANVLSLFKKNQPIVILSGWSEHAISFILYKNNLVRINRGTGRSYYGIEFFKINPELVTQNHIKRLQDSTDREFVLYTIVKELNGQFERGMQKKEQTVGNCTKHSIKTIPQALLYLLLKEVSSDTAYEDSLRIHKGWIEYLLVRSYQLYIKTSEVYSSKIEKAILDKALKKKIDLKKKLPKS